MSIAAKLLYAQRLRANQAGSLTVRAIGPGRPSVMVAKGSGQTSADAAHIKASEHEVRELWQAKEILKKAAPYAAPLSRI